jgi:mono/diheme cytochrome c family protein
MRARLAAALSLLMPAGLGAGEWAAPVAERDRPNPVAVTPQAVSKGRALYQRHCASCHGNGGKGDGPAAGFGADIPDDLTDPERRDRLTDGEIFWKLSTGLRAGPEVVMAGFSRQISSEDDRWRVVAYLRSLRRTDPAPTSTRD